MPVHSHEAEPGIRESSSSRRPLRYLALISLTQVLSLVVHSCHALFVRRSS